jgi:hypothetical protein
MSPVCKLVVTLPLGCAGVIGDGTPAVTFREPWRSRVGRKIPAWRSGRRVAPALARRLTDHAPTLRASSRMGRPCWRHPIACGENSGTRLRIEACAGFITFALRSR